MQDVTFTVSITEANTVLKALGKLPYEESVSLIQKLQLQGQMQVKRMEEASVVQGDPAPVEG